MILSLSFLFYACSENIEGEQFELLKEEILNSDISIKEKSINREMLVFLMSESDCEVCVKSLHNWIKQARDKNADLLMKGLYFKENKTAFSQIDKYLKETENNIDWNITNNKKLFKICEDATQEYGGPFAVKLNKNRMVYVVKINDVDYR